MRKAAPWLFVLVVSASLGCSTMRPSGASHPGVTEGNSAAITKSFPTYSATLVGERMADVMTQDPILDNVALFHDPKSKECRNFSKADRQTLGISMLTPANDVNWEIKAKSKDGHPVTVAIRLKGESGSEVSVLYGSAGDPALSRDLLDKLEEALALPPKDPDVAKTSGSKSSSSRPASPR